MASLSEVLFPGLTQHLEQKRALRVMGRNWAPFVQNEKIKGLLTSDDIADVQAGLSLLGPDAELQRSTAIRGILGRPPEQIGATPFDDEGNPMVRPGVGYLGGEFGAQGLAARLATVPGMEDKALSAVLDLAKPREGFTLSPGQTRYDAGGRPIAQGGPNTSEEIVQVFNPITGRNEYVRRSAAVGMEAPRQPELKQANEWRKAEAGFKDLENALTNLEVFVKEQGTQPSLGPFNATSAKRASTIHATVQGGLRSLFDMGVLQPGELPFLERMVANPGSLLNVGQGGAILGQIQEMRRFVQSKRQTTAERFQETPRRVNNGPLSPAEKAELEYLRRKYGR